MLSRALSTAAAMLLLGSFATVPVRAQNLEAGKSPSQIFAGTCSACHKSSRGLLKTVAPGSLPAYLRQHYTTSSDMASLLSAYLISNGATDTRYGVAPPKEGKPEPTVALEPVAPRQSRRLRLQQQEGAKPDAEVLSLREAAAAARAARRAKRQGKPVLEIPDNAEGEARPAATAVDEVAPSRGKSSARQKNGKKGKPGQEPAKTDAAKTEPAKSEPAKDESREDEPSKGKAVTTEPPKPDAAKIDAGKAEANQPDSTKSDVTKSDEGRAATSRGDSVKGEAVPGEASKAETPLRADPVPAVTPAAKSHEGHATPAQASTPEVSPTPPAASAPPPSGDSVPAASAPVTAPTASPAPPVVTSAPPQPPSVDEPGAPISK